MSKEFNLTRRRVLGGLGTIGVAGAAAGLGTSAYFNDEESFEDNMITAGELDLKVDYVVHEDQGSAGTYTINSIAGTKNGSDADVPTLNGDGTAMSQELTDVKPGDHGYSRFCFTIDDNPAYMWACGKLTANDENGYTEPEPESEENGDINDPGDEDGEGELTDAIEVDVMYCDLDDEGDIKDDGEGDNIMSGTLREVLDQLHGGVPLDGNGSGDAPADDRAPYEGGEDISNPCLCFEWEVPTEVGNEIQGDSVEFDIQFYADQARHNDGTHNPCLVGETGDGFAKDRWDLSPGFNARGRFGQNNPDTGATELDIRAPDDEIKDETNHEWSDGDTQSFEVSSDGSDVTLEVGGESISTSDVAPSDDDAAITVGASDGEVTVENVEVNGQAPSGDDSVSADGETRHLFIAGGGLSDGGSITGDVTFEWDGSPSQEGLKFRVDA